MFQIESYLHSLTHIKAKSFLYVNTLFKNLRFANKTKLNVFFFDKMVCWKQSNIINNIKGNLFLIVFFIFRLDDLMRSQIFLSIETFNQV
jgi:hypothetical protein